MLKEDNSIEIDVKFCIWYNIINENYYQSKGDMMMTLSTLKKGESALILDFKDLSDSSYGYWLCRLSVSFLSAFSGFPLF